MAGNRLKKFTWNDVEIEEDNKSRLAPSQFSITKADAEKRLVFGWALVSATKDGQKIIDHQGDIVEQDDLEDGAYEYVLNFRDAGEEHIGTLRKKARMVESVVFTAEKLKAMGIPAGTVPYGWWIGFYVDDDTTWERIKDGTYKMFSIEGRGIREPVNEPLAKSGSETVGKTFSELIEKFNPYHDSRGRFTTASGGYASFSANPNTNAGRLAIERASQQHPLIGAAYGSDSSVKPKEPTPMTEQEYLNSKGVGDAMSGYTTDKLRGNRELRTRQGKQRFENEVLRANEDYQKRREQARQEYKEKVKSGELRDKTKIEQLVDRANGHPDNPSTQAARRMAEKIGIDWKTGEPLAKSFSELIDIEKFNPYHDSKGRFTTGGSAASFTIRTKDPSKQHMADMAIAREKERAGSATATKPQTDSKAPEKEQKETESPRMQTIQNIENKISNQNFESAAIVDDDGNQILFKDGQASEVGFTRYECMQMANQTMIHNHPRCNMFSYEDLTCMIGNQIYETRVINRDGTVYSMKRADGGYSTEKAREFAEKYQKEYTRGTMHAQRDLDSRGFQTKIWKGEISQAEANIEFGRSCAKYMADWTAKTAPEYGLSFSIEQITLSKSFMRANVMKADKEDNYLILDRDTNDLEDKAFNEWLERAKKSGSTAKSFGDVLTGRSE